MPPLDLARAIRVSFGAEPGAVPDVVQRLAEELGATDVVAYLADFSQRSLAPLPTASRRVDPEVEELTTTMAGRAFTAARPVVVGRAGADRVWVPIIEGSDRTGVLGLTVPEATPAVVAACEELALFAGYLIATHARSTDLYDLRRRRRQMSLAANMQWDLLPPLVLKTDRLAVAGLLEPAYQVGGDCFDYALNGATFDLGLFDPVGHGIPSAMLAALCVGAYRHGRREGSTLGELHQGLEAAVATQLPESFATGQLARIGLDDGQLTWTNAGHPLPMLIRGGQVVKELACPPTPPWGWGRLDHGELVVATEPLEPGDGVLFYTDGITEAHLPGQEQFGVERLADLVGQQAGAGAQPEEVVRRIVRAVLEHQDDRLADDATVVLVQWDGPA